MGFFWTQPEFVRACARVRVYKHCKRMHAIIFHRLHQKSTTHVHMCYCVECVRDGHVRVH